MVIPFPGKGPGPQPAALPFWLGAQAPAALQSDRPFEFDDLLGDAPEGLELDEVLDLIELGRAE